MSVQGTPAAPAAAPAAPAAPAGGEVTTAPPAAAPAAPAAPQAPVAPTIGDTFSDIPEAFRGDEAFKDRDLAGVLNDYKVLRNIQSTREAQGLVTLPDENSAPEVVNAFYERLGMPKSPAEYQFNVPEDLPENLSYNDEKAAKFAQFAHDQKLTQAQASAVHDLYTEVAKEDYARAMGMLDEQLDQNLTELEKIWGGPPDSDKFKQGHLLAMRAFNTAADKVLADKFRENKLLASNPLVLELLTRLGAKMEPDESVSVVDTLPSGRFTDSVTGVEKAIKDFHAAGKFKKMVNGGTTPQERNELRKEWEGLNAKRLQLMSNQ